MTMTLLHGDCRQVLRTLPDCSVDSVVTDPPYELGFMGKQWDASGVAYSVDLWAEVLRVLKPGGHLCAFGGTRTYHRMAVAIEEAGFEIRDSLHWVYGSGFPKSLDVSKAIDKAGGDSGQRLFRHELASAIKASGLTFADIDRRLGVQSTSCYWVRQDHRACLPAPHHWQALAAFLPLSEDLSNLYVQCEREVVGNKKVTGEKGVAGGFANGIASLTDKDSAIQREVPITVPSTDAAKNWDGWGTALKPAHEPIVLARKPLTGTVAANVLEHGTGALNINGTRVGTDDRFGGGAKATSGFVNGYEHDGWTAGSALGRWPANIIFDTEAGAVLDEQSGATDSGGASRFFTAIDWEPQVDMPFRYIAKPSRRERNAGLDGLPERSVGAKGNGLARRCATCDASVIDGCECSDRTFINPTRQNHHPTVKPLALMRWLVRLVTPPGGTVLEPFAGSGTTLMACVLEGFNGVGIEMTDEYLPIIRARVAWAEQQITASLFSVGMTP